MNKTELIKAVAEKSGLNKADTKKTIDAFTNVVSEMIKKNEKVSLVGFGTFSVVLKSARKGINPRTKAQIDIPAKKMMKFKPSADLSDL